MADDDTQPVDDQNVDTSIPEVWRLAKPHLAPQKGADGEPLDAAAPLPALVGKLVKFLNDIEDTEEFEARLQERDPSTGQSLLLWATTTGKFVLAEWLVKKGKRAAFAFSNTKKELTIADKWTELRKELEDKEREKLLAPPEEPSDEPVDEEEKVPEPTLDQLVVDALGDIQEEIGATRFPSVVKSIGELGVYQGARDEQGTKTGLGQTLFPNGDMYCGSYVDNQRQGQGTYFFAADGMIYIGEWKDNLRHGVGRCILPDGSRFYGTYVRDKKHGEGRYTYVDGSSYSGQWDNDVKHGKGQYTFTDGSVFAGTFDHGEFTTGEWRLSGGTRYIGTFKNGRPIGKGLYVFKSGQEGAFQQEGAYSAAGQWIPSGPMSAMDKTPSVDVVVQKKSIPVTFGAECASMTTEQLIHVTNFAPIRDWIKSLEQPHNHSFFVESIVVTGVQQTNPADSTSIDEVRLKVTAIDSKGRRLKDVDQLVFRRPVVRLLVLLTGAGKTLAIIEQQPHAGLLTNEHIALPTVVVSPTGAILGDIVAAVGPALRLSLHMDNMMTLPIRLHDDLSRSIADQKIVVYVQAVHPDTIATAQAKLDAAAPAASFKRFRAVRVEDVPRLSQDGVTIAATSWALRHRESMPQQTVAPQRPPTPVPPPAEPRPDIEPLLAAERAKLAPKKDDDDA